MTVRTLENLPSLYEDDETAWLEAMAELVRAGRVDDLDLIHLAEYLSDMAGRDRREVESRLVVLLAHLLRWDYQPDRRSRSWRAAVIEQRQELEGLASRGVLRNHASDVLARAYLKAIERAAAERGIAADRFPARCPYTVDQLLSVELPETEG
jgi:hypothetical protein